jgi:hypothetical protein
LRINPEWARSMIRSTARRQTPDAFLAVMLIVSLTFPPVLRSCRSSTVATANALAAKAQVAATHALASADARRRLYRSSVHRALSTGFSAIQVIIRLPHSRLINPRERPQRGQPSPMLMARNVGDPDSLSLSARADRQCQRRILGHERTASDPLPSTWRRSHHRRKSPCRLPASASPPLGNSTVPSVPPHGTCYAGVTDIEIRRNAAHIRQCHWR